MGGIVRRDYCFENPWVAKSFGKRLVSIGFVWFGVELEVLLGWFAQVTITLD